MNIRKTLLTTTLFFAGTATALLADNGKAIEFYKTGRIEPAKAMLLQNLATGAGDKAEAAYYLGEIYKDANQLDSAAYYYGVGKAADPANLMNSIGELSLLKLKNPTAADQQFEALLSNKLNRKNPDLPSLYVAAAAAYKDRPIKAEEFLNKAKAMDKKLASIYVLEADMQAANKDYNGAAAQLRAGHHLRPELQRGLREICAHLRPDQLGSRCGSAEPPAGSRPLVGSRTPRAGRNLLQGRQTAQSR